MVDPQTSARVPTRYWHRLDDGRVQCDLCPRACRLAPGQRGFCFVREGDETGVVLTTWGRASGFCIDPIEKKPLHHFLPGTPVLSFGTAGCNLGCKYCQNWDISKSREVDTLCAEGTPAQIVRAAHRHGCRSVAFTYNDPVVFHEYAIDVAKTCRSEGIRTVAVTAGEVCPEPRREFYAWMDAANVDLKAFSDRFYRKLCGGALEPVLETLEYVARETETWLEITTLLIPGWNDTDGELDAMCGWVVERLGDDVPMHFTAFHPDWRLRDVPPTPPATLRRAVERAHAAGVRHAYTGNVPDPRGQTTTCTRCGAALIERRGYEIGGWGLDAEGRCAICGTRLAGRFEARPGSWGSRRLPVRLA